MLAATTTSRSGILNAYAFVRQKLTKSQVAILAYHRVSPSEDMHHLQPISLACFRKQIRYVSEHFEILSLDQLVNLIRLGRAFPKRAAVITFDDGYKDNYEYAYPVLQEYEIPATIFIATGALDNLQLFWWDKVEHVLMQTTKQQVELNQLGNYGLETRDNRIRAIASINETLKRMPEDKKNMLIDELSEICEVKIQHDVAKEVFLSWDAVREMNRNGISFGAHTVNHPILTNLPLRRANDEIVESKRILERRLGKTVTSFAYPNGDFNAGIADLVARSGFTCAVTVGAHRLISRTDDVYGLERIIPDNNMDKLKAMLSGLAGDALSLIR